MTKTYPLSLVKEHLFVELPDGLWLVDTGASHSLGPQGSRVALGGIEVPTEPRYLGASLASIQKLVGVPFRGLIGLNLLAQLELVFDLPAGKLHVSALPGLSIPGGQAVELLNAPFGIPSVRLNTLGEPHTWWVDTGAKLSYFQPRKVLETCEYAGDAKDFFPVVGRFTVKTYQVPVEFGRIWTSLRAGRLPWPVSSLLTRGGTDGIVGVDLFKQRQVGIFPAQRELVVGFRKAA